MSETMLFYLLVMLQALYVSLLSVAAAVFYVVVEVFAFRVLLPSRSWKKILSFVTAFNAFCALVSLSILHIGRIQWKMGRPDVHNYIGLYLRYLSGS